MDVATLFSTISSAASNAKKVLEASKTLANAELKQLIAELAMQLADAKLQLAELRHELIRLQEANTNLTAKVEKPKPTMQWGCYKFDGHPGLYCPKCFEQEGKMHRTARAMNGHFYRCSVCGAMHPTH